MASVDFIECKGKKILYENYAGCSPETLGPYLAKAKEIISRQPPRSVLALVNVTGAKFDMTTADAMKDFVRANTPYIKCSAIFGLGGLQNVIYRAVVVVTGRDNLKVCENEEKAKELLVSLS